MTQNTNRIARTPLAQTEGDPVFSMRREGLLFSKLNTHCVQPSGSTLVSVPLMFNPVYGGNKFLRKIG
jgi:hypothetical protein